MGEVSYDPNYRVNWLGKILMFSHERDNLKAISLPSPEKGEEEEEAEDTREEEKMEEQRGEWIFNTFLSHSG